MDFENFLANIYFGYLDAGRLKSLQFLDSDAKIRELLSKYREVSSEYPATYLEKVGVVPKELMERLKQIEFFGLGIPQAYGGAGLSLIQYLKVVEEVAKQDMVLGMAALAHLSIGIKGILLFGNEAQKKQYLVPAASGEMIFSYALTEPKKGSDAKNIETTATLSQDGNYYILKGLKSYITNANYAGGLTVFAQMDPQKPGFMGAFIVETSWEGVKIGKEMPKLGLTASSTATIQFKDVRVPRENLLGKPGDGFKIAMTVLNYGRLALSAASIGMMNQSLADMVKRSADRKQFGVPINHFELIQEKLVKAKVNSYVASAMTAFTADMLATDPLAPVAIESSHCKLFGTTRAWDTIYDALQVAGGSGYLNTQPYGRRMRDFRVTTIFEGTTEIHSIYPALYLIRNLNKRMQNFSKRKVFRFLFLLKGLLRGPRWKIQPSVKATKQAFGVANSHARRINFLIRAGIVIYGKKIHKREFFLRRITTLSLCVFGLLSAATGIELALKSGRDVAEDLKLLAYLVEDAREIGKQNKYLFPTRREHLHQKIVAALIE